MRFVCPALVALLFLAGAASGEEGTPKFPATDWPWWRGPQRNGIAAAEQTPLQSWSATENILWRAEVPGRGHGSPTIVGEHIYLATAEEDRQVQSVACYRRQDGEKLWQTELHQGNLPKEGHNNKSTSASSTIACDGERIFVNFLNNKAIYTTALTLDGKVFWQTKINDYTLHQGFSSSPAVYEDLLLVSADNKGGTGVIAGLKRNTGEFVWRFDRPKFPNYTSPIVFTIDGKDQLLFTGCDVVTSLDPRTGKKIWECEGSTTECVTSTVTDGKRVITSGGYPKNHVAAVAADGSGKIEWQNTSRVYVPSMLMQNGYLYAILDAGTAICWEAATGKEQWKGRLGGDFSASPVLVGDVIYAVNEGGKMFVLRATPEKFELLGTNQLGDEAFATPTIVGGKIYQRFAERQDGKRHEFLVCIGAK